jgi:hypothetical protein
VEYSANTKFSPGQASWLLVKQAPLGDVISEPGQTVEVYQNNPFVLNLAPGWNQIGNPYNFNISWQDVVNANGIQVGSDLAELSIYNGGFQNSNLLSKFSGGFVFNPNASNISLSLPVLKNNTVNNRPLPPITFERNVNLEAKNWAFPLRLTLDEDQLSESVFGIDQKAAINKDNLDRVNLPDFEHLEFAKISFIRDYFFPDFKYDFIPGNDGIWHFEVKTNLTERERIRISWNDIEVVGDRQLFLLDLTTNRLHSLSQKGSLAIGKNVHGYEIYFGDESYLAEHRKPQTTTIGLPYPNPMLDIVTFDIATVEANFGSITLYDLQGKTIIEQPIVIEDRSFVSIQLNLDASHKSQVMIYEVKLNSGAIKRGKILR